MAFATQTAINLTQLAYLAVSAFECNDMTASWCESAKPVTLPEGITSPWYADPKFWESDFQITVVHDDPEDDGQLTTVVSRADVQKGFDVMASKYPSHMGDFLSENHDAETADVWWQCVVLGDIIYG